MTHFYMPIHICSLVTHLLMLCESKGIRPRKQTGKLPCGINADFFEISVKARFFLLVDLRDFYFRSRVGGGGAENNK